MHMLKPRMLLKLAAVGLIALCMPRSAARPQGKPANQPNRHRQTDEDAMQPGERPQQAKR